MTHSTHFIYGYMASDIWLRTILIVRKETRCCHIGYSFRLTARVLLYAPSHRQDSTYTTFVTPVVEHWLEREIAQWVHHMKDRSDDPSHHERMPLPQSYISLHNKYEYHQFYVMNNRFTTKLLTSLWGSPAAENIGIFCPRAMLFIVSIAVMPVCIISSG